MRIIREPDSTRIYINGKEWLNTMHYNSFSNRMTHIFY